MRAQTHFNNHILVTLWSIIPRLFCYHRFHSPYVFCVHVNLSARGSSNLYVCRREGGGVNVDVDGRHKRSKLLRTFEPPSFVMTKKNHGTVTARKDNRGYLTQKDGLRSMWLFREQESCESSKGKERKLFPRMRFLTGLYRFSQSWHSFAMIWNKQMISSYI